MPKLPQQLTIDALANRWASLIEPFLNRPTNQANLLKEVQLVNGTNVINHRLGRKLQGWYLTRIRGAAVIYDNQDANQKPEQSLILVSNADVSVDLAVF